MYNYDSTIILFILCLNTSVRVSVSAINTTSVVVHWERSGVDQELSHYIIDYTIIYADGQTTEAAVKVTRISIIFKNHSLVILLWGIKGCDTKF